MKHDVIIIYGDGIGPEVTRGARQIVDAAGGQIQWHEQFLGLTAIEKYGQAVPLETLDSIKKATVCLKGPTSTPIAAGHKSANVTLRKELDLYACIRPIKSIRGVFSRYDNVDLVIVRENTEGLYAGQEFLVQPGCAISLRVMTERACHRIAKAAFSYAETHHRKKVTLGHKANILKLGDGLLLEQGHKVSQSFSTITYDQMIIDALCMRLVTDPTAFDVLFMENMFGDIISDLCAGLVGGLGVAAGANIGDEIAVFEAVHGSAPDIAGQDIANPTAMIMSAIMMLDHLGEREIALRINRALLAVLQEKQLKTKDLGGQSGTKQFVNNIINNMI